MRLTSKSLLVLSTVPLILIGLLLTRPVAAGLNPYIQIQNWSYEDSIPTLGNPLTVSGYYFGPAASNIRVQVWQSDENGDIVRDSNGNPEVLGSVTITVTGGHGNWTVTMPSPAVPGGDYFLDAQMISANGIYGDDDEVFVYGD